MPFVTPGFVGEAEDVTLATAAWEAATECAGRPGVASREVEVVRRTLPLDYLGVARTGADGALFRIELDPEPERRREVLLHEVAHAWVSNGPVTLVEGAAELLADCMVRVRPGLGPLAFDDGRPIGPALDLRAWEAPSASAPSVHHAVRTDAYIAAARLLRTAAEVVGERRFWSGEPLSFGALEGWLAADPRGLEVVSALRGGGGTQAAGLEDADHDGLTALQERWRGTSPDAWDSDGDGFWDGTTAPAAAVPVPLDGSPICALGGVRAVSSGLRGASWTPVAVDDGLGVGLVRFAVAPGPDTVGGTWVLRAGDDDPACRSDADLTVYAADPAWVALVDEVTRDAVWARATFALRFGAVPERLVLALGTPSTAVEHGVVGLSSADLLRATRRGVLRELVAEAVAARRLAADGVLDWSGAESLALSIER